MAAVGSIQRLLLSAIFLSLLRPPACLSPTSPTVFQHLVTTNLTRTGSGAPAGLEGFQSRNLSPHHRRSLIASTRQPPTRNTPNCREAPSIADQAPCPSSPQQSPRETRTTITTDLTFCLQQGLGHSHCVYSSWDLNPWGPPSATYDTTIIVTKLHHGRRS